MIQKRILINRPFCNSLPVADDCAFSGPNFGIGFGTRAESRTEAAKTGVVQEEGQARVAAEPRSAWLSSTLGPTIGTRLSVFALGILVFGIYSEALLHTLHGSSPMESFADDFAYYAEIARRFLDVHFTTFDGIRHTNGFHPLWMWILTGMMVAFGNSFLPAVLLVTALSIASTYVLGFWLLHRAGLQEELAVFFAMVGTAVAAMVEVGSMESVVTIPALLLLGSFVLKSALPSKSSWFLLGLLCSLTILCRIDTLLFVALLLALLFWQADANRWRNLAFLAYGLLPAGAYFIQNKLVFGAMITISSRAKQSTVGFHPTLLPLVSAFTRLLGVGYIYCFVGLVLLLTERDRNVRAKPLFVAALLFPWLQIATLCMVSDWPLEGWYAYTLVVPCLITSVLLVRRLDRGIRLSLVPAAALAVLVLVGVCYKKFHATTHDSIGSAAMALATWSSSHPGNMAMGDRAGKVGWMVPARLLQLEGLVEDQAFLRRIHAQDDAVQVMKDYDIRYYVATYVTPNSDGCYAVAEPGRAGPYAAKMHARICAKPVFEFKDKPLPGEVPDCCSGTVNDVFDLQPLVQDKDRRWVNRSNRGSPTTWKKRGLSDASHS